MKQDAPLFWHSVAIPNSLETMCCRVLRQMKQAKIWNLKDNNDILNTILMNNIMVSYYLAVCVACNVYAIKSLTSNNTV